MPSLGYCLKCRAKDREMKDVSEVDMGRGRKALKGVCTVCGSGMYRILAKSVA